MTHVVVGAFRTEVAPLIDQLEGRRRVKGVRRAWRGRLRDVEVVVGVVGMGARKAGTAAAALLRAVPEARVLIGVGFAGGLDPDLVPGDLVAGRTLVDADGEDVGQGDEVWLERATAVPGVRAAAIAVTSALAATPEGKARLRALPPAPAAVDMESASLARMAREAAVPFLALRVVLDPAGEALKINLATLPSVARASWQAAESLAQGVRLLLGAGPSFPPVLRALFHLKPLLMHRTPDGGRRRGWPVYPVRIEGEGNLPHGPCVLAFNHQSWLDVVVTTATVPCHLRLMAKAELYRGPRLLRWFLEATRMIPVDRDRGTGLDAAVRALAGGSVIGIFPEGTIPGEEGTPKSAILPDTGLLRGKTGAVRLALAAGVPLVPVGLSGTGRALPVEAAPHLKQVPIPRVDVPLVLRYGEPLELSDADGEDVRAATDRLMHAIAALVDRQEAPVHPEPVHA